MSAKVSSCYLGNANGHFHIGNPNLASEGRSLAELVEINLNKMPVPWEEYLVLGFCELANSSYELIVLMRSEAFANVMHVTILE